MDELPLNPMGGVETRDIEIERHEERLAGSGRRTDLGPGLCGLVVLFVWRSLMKSDLRG
jgi:hypothetical protein